MSTLYEENFWKGYDIIYEHYMKRKNQFNQLNYVLSKLSLLYDNFGQGLKEVITDVTMNQENESNEDSFDNFFVEYYKKLNLQADYYIKLGETINKEYVEKPLGLEYKDINFTYNLLEMEHNNKEITRDEYFNNIESKYLEELQVLEMKKKGFFDSIEKSVKYILEKKKNKKEFVPDESTKEYLIQLLFTEKKRKEYVGKYRMMLRHYYNTEKKFMEQTKIKMEKCANLINDLSTNLHSLYLDNKYIDDINVEQNLNNFVSKKKTLGFPPFQLDFINYTIDYNSISKDIAIKEQDKLVRMENVKDYLLSVSKVISSQLNSNYKKIEEYFNALFSGPFEEKQKEELIKLFSDKTTDEERKSNANNDIIESKAGLYKTVGIKNQIAFLSLLNNRRTNSYEISETNFNILGEIVQFIMNDTKQTELEIYYKIIGWCIILSQTFKCIKNGQEIYIQQLIENNEIFSNKDFWISLCRFYIADNFYKGKSYTTFSTSLSEEDVRKIKSIANSKSLTIVHNLFSFHVKMEIIEEVIDLLSTTYDIDKEYLESIKASMMGKDTKK